MSILRITYADQLAISEFFLNDQVLLMEEEGAVLNAILGNSTQLDGFDCTQNSPADLNVVLSKGSIFKYQNVLDTNLGELPTQIPADTNHQIPKCAYKLDDTIIAITPPATPGFSRNDLIQINFQELDGNPQPIPFYNGFTGQVLNPPVIVTKNVQRIDSVVIQLKPGVPAATGTQVTPSPDTGFVGAWVVTTNSGQTTITNSDITRYPGTTFLTEKLKDKISQATADLRYAQLAVDNIFLQPQTIPIIGAGVSLSTAQSIPSGNVETKINFDTVGYDTNSLWNNTTKRFTITKPGYYSVSSRIFFNAQTSTGTGNAHLILHKNGTGISRLSQLYTSSDDITLPGYIELPLVANDYLELYISNSTTQTTNIGSVDNYSFQIRYIGS